MRVALVDNMNNNFFSLTRYLRDLGIDAHLYEVARGDNLHFSPQSDTFKNVSDYRWIHDFPVRIDGKGWLAFNSDAIRDEFQSYDIVISCGVSSAFLKRAGVESKIVIPYGSDLYDIPFRRITLTFSSRFIKSFVWAIQAYYQCKAYKDAQILITDDSYPLYDAALKKLNIKPLNIGMPMLYNLEDWDTNENKKIWGFMNNYDFIVFNHSRQYWKSNHDCFNDFELYGGAKRNDKLLVAFKKFIEVTSYKKPLLVLFEYGIDVEATKQMIESLQIGDYVHWMPTMNRKNILYGLSKADFSSNAFRENTVDIGGVCYESLAVGTPHLNNCKEVLMDCGHKFYRAPMLHALSSDEILEHFNKYEENPEYYKSMRRHSIEWFDNNLGKSLAKKYIDLMIRVKDNSLKKIDDFQSYMSWT